MADPEDRKPRKTVLELFLEKMRTKPPAPPERSYFTKPEPEREPDRKAERKQAARLQKATAAQRTAAEAKDKDRLAKAFRPATLDEETRLDQRIENIAQEDLREAAREAREDARELLEINRAAMSDVLKQDRDFWRPYDASRPIPEDTAKQQNQTTRERTGKLALEAVAIQDRMEGVIARCEVESWRLTPQITYEPERPTHQPAEQPSTVAGWLTEAQRAAAMPPGPKPPGVDVSR